MQTKCIVKYKLQYNKWPKYSGLTGCSWNWLLFVLFKNGRDDHVMMTPTKNMASPVDSSLHKEVFGVISGAGETQRPNQPLSDSFTETSSLFVPLKYLWTSMSYVRPYRVKIIMFRLLFYEKYYLRTIMSSILMCFVFVSLSSHSDRELCTVHWLTQLSYQHRLWKRPIRAQHWEATPPRQGTAHMTWLSFLCTLFMMDCYHVLFMYRSVCLSQ